VAVKRAVPEAVAGYSSSVETVALGSTALDEGIGAVEIGIRAVHDRAGKVSGQIAVKTERRLCRGASGRRLRNDDGGTKIHAVRDPLKRDWRAVGDRDRVAQRRPRRCGCNREASRTELTLDRADAPGIEPECVVHAANRARQTDLVIGPGCAYCD